MVFGDIFRQRADYSKGLFYSGRNGIFGGLGSPDAKKVHPNTAQMVDKNLIIKPKEGGASSSSSSSANLLSNTTTTTTPVASRSSTATAQEPLRQLSNEKIVLSSKNKPTRSSISLPVIPPRKDFTGILSFKFVQDTVKAIKSPKRSVRTYVIENKWKIEEYGGIKMWVNQNTGEVSIENPHKKLQFAPSSPKRANGNSPAKHSILNRKYLNFSRKGTGCSDNSPMKRGWSSSDKENSVHSTVQNPDLKELFACLDGKQQESQKIISKPLQT